jgi:hypothetical protein
MIDYQFLFNVLMAFLIGYIFRYYWEKYNNMKECPTCKGYGYVNKNRLSKV